MTKEERKLAQQELKLSNKELKELLSICYKDEVIIQMCIRYVQVHPRNRKFRRQFVRSVINAGRLGLILKHNLNMFIIYCLRTWKLEKTYNFSSKDFIYSLRKYKAIRKVNKHCYKSWTKRDFPKLKNSLTNEYKRRRI